MAPTPCIKTPGGFRRLFNKIVCEFFFLSNLYENGVAERGIGGGYRVSVLGIRYDDQEKDDSMVEPKRRREIRKECRETFENVGKSSCIRF